MKIQVEDKLFIESDGMQFILKKYNGQFDKKTGNELFKSLGYFATLQQAVKFLVRKKVMESEATTVQELLHELERIEKEIETLITV
jgi:hypothetical protein